MPLTPNYVYRDYETDGVPNSGAHTPIKSEIRALLNLLSPNGGMRNVYASPNGASTTQTNVTADDIVLFDTLGNTARVLNVSVMADLTTSGANGLDFGSVANSTWYYFYVIYNQITGVVAGLWSTHATLATIALPSGYTFGRRVFEAITDSSSHIYRSIGRGNRRQYVLTPATNTSQLPQYAAGTGSVSFWTAKDATLFVPPTASKLTLQLLGEAANTSNFAVAPNPNYLANFSAGLGGIFSATTALISVTSLVEFMLESTNFYYGFTAASGASYAINCLGWEDSLGQ